ncbi:hypothetical protein FRACA_350017 [Frankia canadensis]|uniref:Uncharacterized protein n=1 Tax=Frankia canadensis TaxID=1836972 RepID=A0A2I2KV95_9ACTN|nr:hypothetical protein FRACA_350017 [Frankia canadensis]SOU56883.1 hypothetical protein FRACA_350017 [Frankia canadensis]
MSGSIAPSDDIPSSPLLGDRDVAEARVRRVLINKVRLP